MPFVYSKISNPFKSVLKGFPPTATSRSPQRSGSNESVRVHWARYLVTLLLLKLTITPFASVGYHGGRWCTLDRITFGCTHTTRTRARLHTDCEGAAGAGGKKQRKNVRESRVRNTQTKQHASFQPRVSAQTDEQPRFRAALPPPFPLPLLSSVAAVVAGKHIPLPWLLQVHRLALMN